RKSSCIHQVIKTQVCSGIFLIIHHIVGQHFSCVRIVNPEQVYISIITTNWLSVWTNLPNSCRIWSHGCNSQWSVLHLAVSFVNEPHAHHLQKLYFIRCSTDPVGISLDLFLSRSSA